MTNWGGGGAAAMTQPMEPVETMNMGQPVVMQAPVTPMAEAGLSGKSKAGYLLIGLCGGLFGLLGTWLVQSSGDSRKGGVKWALIGIAINLALGVVFVTLLTMIMSSMATAVVEDMSVSGMPEISIEEPVAIDDDEVPMTDGTVDEVSDEGMVYVGTEAENTNVDENGVDMETVEIHEAEDMEASDEDHGADYITTDAEGVDNLTYPETEEEE